MRDKFQKELEELNEEIIEMGKMIVYDIQNAVKALVTRYKSGKRSNSI